MPAVVNPVTQRRVGAAGALAVAAVVSLTVSAAKAAVVFNDTFASSTINLTSTPSGNSTSYDIASARSATASIAPGHLLITQAKSTSTIVEAQAVFTSSPITLATAGDSIELTVTFTDTVGVPVAMYFGLYNSGGTVPFTDLMNGSTSATPPTGLNSVATGDAFGGVQNWQGYNANLQGGNTATSYKIQTRPKQTGTTNTNQDLLTAGASSSQSYSGASQLGSAANPGTIQFVVGNQYTEDFVITMMAGGTYSFTSNLYAGASASGSPLVTINGADPSTASPPLGPFLYNGFDGLAFGNRETDNLGDAMDVQSVMVSTNVAAVPEPASLGAIAVAGLALLTRRRKA
ncbi:MAG TPA: PEP-CTERM sorting domain-containing protein [Phycisphaerae bacterium]|nr:PEP-CTERM sorting domain-containing protein [Phycisphaerae bacterium]